jgi:hypothetical protein
VIFQKQMLHPNFLKIAFCLSLKGRLEHCSTLLPLETAGGGATIPNRRFNRRLLQEPRRVYQFRSLFQSGGRDNLSSKNHNFFIKLYGDKLYMKIVVFFEIYNFVVQIFFI